MEINYRIVFRKKRRFIQIEHEVTIPGLLTSLDQVPALYARFVQLQMECEITIRFNPCLLFIAVISRMDNPLFMDDASRLRSGLANKLSDVLGRERSKISHNYKDVKNYMHIYTSFRDEVNYFYRKMAEIENI